MGFRIAVDSEQNLVVLTFEGEIPYEEEAAAILEIIDDPRVEPDPRILVDRTRSKMASNAANIRQHVQLFRAHEKMLGRSRIAHIATNDRDFGMLRMFELTTNDLLDREIKVARNAVDACAFLDIDPDSIDLPERSQAP